MRTAIIIFALAGCFSFFLIASCNDKKYPEPVYYWGEVSAMKNGMQWSAKPRAGHNLPFNIGLDVLMDVYNSEDQLRERLSISKIPIDTGYYRVLKTSIQSSQTFSDTTTAFYFTIQDDGDVLEGSYYINANDTSHFVEITSIDNTQSIFEGNFQLSFILDPEDKIRYPYLPDTIRFTNGSFRTKILELND